MHKRQSIGVRRGPLFARVATSPSNQCLLGHEDVSWWVTSQFSEVLPTQKDKRILPACLFLHPAAKAVENLETLTSWNQLLAHFAYGNNTAFTLEMEFFLKTHLFQQQPTFLLKLSDRPHVSWVSLVTQLYRTRTVSWWFLLCCLQCACKVTAITDWIRACISPRDGLKLDCGNVLETN